MGIVNYSSEDIAAVKAAAQASAKVLHQLADAVVPGMSTWHIDQLAAAFINETGGESAFLGYRGFPGQICISVNEEVVHGIGRTDKIIEPGDLVSLDVGVKLNGYYGDNALTVCVGKEAQGIAQQLLQVTEEALYAGIDQAIAGNFVYDVSAAIENVVRKAGFTIIRELCGHGCGKKLHEKPDIPNYTAGKRNRSAKLQKGMIICIEPMVNAGKAAIEFDEEDGWTVRAKDKSLSAHFEHQILITENKAEILTVWQKTA